MGCAVQLSSAFSPSEGLRTATACHYSLQHLQCFGKTQAHISPPTRGVHSQSFPAPSCSAESDFPNSQLPRSAPGLSLRHNMTAPIAPHAVPAALACTCTPFEPLHVLTSSDMPWPLPGAARPSRVSVRVSRLHCQRDPELPASCCASVYTESSAHMRRGHSHALSRDHGNPFPHR